MIAMRIGWVSARANFSQSMSISLIVGSCPFRCSMRIWGMARVRSLRAGTEPKTPTPSPPS